MTDPSAWFLMGLSAAAYVCLFFAGLPLWLLLLCGAASFTCIAAGSHD